MSAVLGPALTTAASLTLVMMEGGFCWSVAVPAWASVAAWARAGAVGEHGLAPAHLTGGRGPASHTVFTSALWSTRGLA